MLEEIEISPYSIRIADFKSHPYSKFFVDQSSYEEFMELQIGHLYEALIARKPETIEAVRTKLESNEFDLQRIVKEFIHSSEFQSTITRQSRATLEEIKQWESLTESELDDLLKVTDIQWEKLGTEDPYWSVLSADEYTAEKFDENENGFWKSGADEVALLLERISNHVLHHDFQKVLEIGSGVGRLTKQLLKHWNLVVGSDVSSTNLEICKLQCDSPGFTPLHFNKLTDLDSVAEFDLFFSVISLQHNTPPIQFHLVDRCLESLSSGGLAYFQTPISDLNGHWDLESYYRLIGDEPRQMDMYALPQEAVLYLFGKHNVSVLNIFPDTYGGEQHLSQTYFGRKN